MLFIWCATECAMYKSAAHTLLCSTQYLQHKLKPHITNLTYASQLNILIERCSWLRQAWPQSNHTLTIND